MSSFLRAAMRHRCEAKQRLRVGAGRTCSCLEGPCRAQINFDLHDLESLISRQCVASKAPEPGCRQSIRRRRRPSNCSRCCRVPQPRQAHAKSASIKLSPSTTKRLETPLLRSLLSVYITRNATMCDGYAELLLEEHALQPLLETMARPATTSCASRPCACSSASPSRASEGCLGSCHHPPSIDRLFESLFACLEIRITSKTYAKRTRSLNPHCQPSHAPPSC